ncbi:hypothetical protein SAMN04489712_101422 [Thermomonospora echinospora]|uniref:Uncharacterized protein n=1 Tax=Thermomonospora echinospora TaxID=1992 RepID=A0A1H5SZD4_9ACTN|nr:hypothetical protein [Thermomonospora echinospora]SEF55889.1 hypothetical protein SAMN04489712_101422 [Thermomonospora echinospora]
MIRRQLCDRPIRVRLHDDRPVAFWTDGREYEVTALMEMVGLIRVRDDVDTCLWQVRARSRDGREVVYDLVRDHGDWRMAAVWV